MLWDINLCLSKDHELKCLIISCGSEVRGNVHFSNTFVLRMSWYN